MNYYSRDCEYTLSIPRSSGSSFLPSFAFFLYGLCSPSSASLRLDSGFSNKISSLFEFLLIQSTQRRRKEDSKATKWRKFTEISGGVMASSKVITTTSQTNPEVPRHPSLCTSLSTLLADLQNQSHNSNCLGSMSMEDLLKNIYSSPPPPPQTSSDTSAHPQFLGASISREGSFLLPKDVANKSVDEVWKEIVAGGGEADQRQEGQLEEMTLEDFLTKAGAVREDDVRCVYPVDPVVVNGGGNQFSTFGNNGAVDHNQRLVVVTAGGGSARGKRRTVEEPPLDKATQQKQRRMIKNRESAARSRERKQAYTVELESMVTHLEEENARLLKEEAELNKERLKQLMDNLIPVDKKQRPRRVFRRVHSMEW